MYDFHPTFWVSFHKPHPPFASHSNTKTLLPKSQFVANLMLCQVTLSIWKTIFCPTVNFLIDFLRCLNIFSWFFFII